MESFDGIFKEIENYDPDAVLERIINSLNNKTERRIEEIDIFFNDVSKNSVGGETKKKKSNRVRKSTLVLLLAILLFTMTGCKSKKENPDIEITNGYQDILNSFEQDLYKEAYNKGTKIGSDMFYSLTDEGNVINSEDIICEIANIINTDNWYLKFETNFSVINSQSINDYKYGVAISVYEGIIEQLGDETLWPASLDQMCKNLVGDNLILFDEVSKKIIYSPLEHEITEQEIVNNVVELSKYYKQRDKDNVLTRTKEAK